jgi:hypothetical protein
MFSKPQRVQRPCGERNKAEEKGLEGYVAGILR